MDAEQEAAAAVPAAKVAGGVVAEGDKNAADVAPAAGSSELTDDDTSCKVVAGPPLLRLSEEYVRCVLAMKPVFVVDPDEEYARMANHPGKIYSQEFIDESVEIFRDLAESSKRVFAGLEKLQDWMRAELEEKGCVEVDDEYIARRVMVREALEVGAEESLDAFGSMKVLDAYRILRRTEGKVWPST